MNEADRKDLSEIAARFEAVKLTPEEQKKLKYEKERQQRKIWGPTIRQADRHDKFLEKLERQLDWLKRQGK